MSVCISRLSEHAELLEAARGLLREYILLPDAWEEFGLGPSDAEAFLTVELHDFPGTATPPRGEVLVATAGADPVGLGEIVPFRDDACELRRVHVVAPHQGSGIGRMLASGLLADARSAGYATAVLDVLPSRHAAQRFWRSIGFTETAPFREHPFPMLFMRRSLVEEPRGARGT